MRMSRDDVETRRQVLADISDAGRVLSTAMVHFHTNLARRVGLGPSEEKMLELIGRLDRPTVVELANHTGLAKNSVSDALNRLQSKGFITREPHPDDGRKVAIVTTDDGVDRIASHFAGLLNRLAALHEDYSTEQLAVIADYQLRAAEIQEGEARRLAD